MNAGLALILLIKWGYAFCVDPHDLFSRDILVIDDKIEVGIFGLYWLTPKATLLAGMSFGNNGACSNHSIFTDDDWAKNFGTICNDYIFC